MRVAGVELRSFDDLVSRIARDTLEWQRLSVLDFTEYVRSTGVQLTCGLNEAAQELAESGPPVGELACAVAAACLIALVLLCASGEANDLLDVAVAASLRSDAISSLAVLFTAWQLLLADKQQRDGREK